MSHHTTSGRRRSGFSLLEVQVSFVLFGLALTGLTPLTVMHLRQLNKLEQRLEAGQTHYLVPATTEWERRLGAAATVTTNPVTPPSYPTEGYINFQRSVDPAPGSFDGHTYRADVGSAFGDRGNGYYYGWNGLNNTGANRNKVISPDERYDTLTMMQSGGSFTWETAVPNGLYKVRVVCGDPNFAIAIYSLNVEGVPAVFGIPLLTKHWFEGTRLVAVRDGRLTISNALGALGNRINFVEYSSATTPTNEVQILSLDKSLGSEEVSVQVSISSL